MMNFTKKVLSRTLWLGRGTATVMGLAGLAMLLALTVGLASTALAGTGVGARFDLGTINAVDALTRLTGTTNNALLRIQNDSKGPNATALDLQVDPKKPPMKVSSFTKVERLNADLLDGRSADQFVTLGGKSFDSDNLDGKDSTDFFSGDTYTVRRDEGGPGGGQDEFVAVSCDPEDKVLGGGGGVSPELFTQVDDGTVNFSRPGNLGSWDVSVQDNGSPSNVFVEAVCVDFPPLR